MKYFQALVLIAFAGCSEAISKPIAATNSRSAKSTVTTSAGQNSVVTVRPQAEMLVAKPATAPAVPVLTLTESAASKLKSARESTKAKYVRVQCKKGGCSGFIYDMQLVNSFDKSQDLVFHESGVPIAMDLESIKLLRGTTLDFLSEKGVQGFKFKNPNKPEPAEDQPAAATDN